MYIINIHREAKRKLKSLDAKDRLRITDKIMSLAHYPDDPTLDVKKLSGQHRWRLRIGHWRVLYHRDNVLKIIGIEKIKPRGDAYK